ncbi:MAG: hypothetical protein ACR2F1_15670 [Nitrososphaeraceae archaeon]
MTTILFDWRVQLMMIVPTNNENKDQYKKLFTIQYTKKELDQIQSEFVEQMNKYIARVNNRIIKTLEEIEKEAEVVEVFPSTSTTRNQ